MKRMSQEQKFITMNFAEWEAIYKPIKNPYASYPTYEFDTLGDEFEMVLRAHKSNNFCIWTWLDAEDSRNYPNGYILNGSHFCNRSGHLITEIPWPENVFIEVEID